MRALSELDLQLDRAVLAVRIGGAVHRHYRYASDLEVVAKSDDQTAIKTIVDDDTGLTVAYLLASTPRLRPTLVVGEEHIYQIDADGRVTIGEIETKHRHDEHAEWRRPDAASYWVVDGLDGTGNFERQALPIYCTSLAYVHHGQVQVGA